MRNFNLLLVLIVLFTSCSDFEEPNSFDDGSIETQKHLKSYGEHELLGYSWDITEDYSGLNYDITPPLRVIDIDAFKLDHKNKYYSETPGGGNNNCFAGATSLDLLNEMKVKTKADVCLDIMGIKLFQPFSANFSLTSEQDTKYELSTKYSFGKADVYKRLQRLRIDYDDSELFKKYVYPDFYDALNRLTPDDFVKKYGTHILTDVTMGGRLIFNYKSTIIEESSYERKKKIVEAGLRFTVKSFGADLKGSYEEEEINQLKTKNSTWETTIEYVGGAHSGISQKYTTEKGLTETEFSQKEWEMSVTKDNCALTDINWTKAIPIYDLISDPTKKAQIKTAVINYIASKQINILDLQPLYRYYSSKAKNHFYTNTYQGKVFDVDQYQFESDEVYMLKNKDSGSVPLYRYYSSKARNHYYTTTWKGNVFDVNQYTFERIEGYVFNTKIKGTIPVYQYYSPIQNNHFYVSKDLGANFDEGFIREGIGFYAFPGNSYN